jgi:hypothetical protein
MKKLGLLFVITCLVIGTVFAQNQERERRSPPETITVQGTLQLQNGVIAVKSGETVYYVPMLQRLVGFVDAIKEGNTVSIEGYANKTFLLPTKVTAGGKSYDFPAMGFAQRTGTGQRNEARPQLRQGKNNRFAPGARGQQWQRQRMPAKRGHSYGPAKGRGAWYQKR